MENTNFIINGHDEGIIGVITKKTSKGEVLRALEVALQDHFDNAKIAVVDDTQTSDIPQTYTILVVDKSEEYQNIKITLEQTWFY